MDEDKTEDQVVETNESEETPPIEATEDPQVVEDEVETPEPEAEAEPDEPVEEEEQPVSRRENKRIQDLTRKLAEAQQSTPQRVTQQRQIIDDGDYSSEEVNGLAQQYGQEQYNAGLARANAIAFQTDLKIDAPRVAQKYEVLDQNSDNFDPGVAAFINESYLKTVGYNAGTGMVQNNNIGYEEYVDAQMELVEALSASKSADSTRNLAKQAARTGVRPSGVSKSYSGADPSKMSLEQLQAAALDEAKRVKF